MIRGEAIFPHLGWLASPLIVREQITVLDDCGGKGNRLARVPLRRTPSPIRADELPQRRVGGTIFKQRHRVTADIQTHRRQNAIN